MTTEFFKDLEIFVTGGSGVVGKAAIEKLLRSCDVKRIYVLLRCKRGVKVEDRLEQMKNSRIFNVLKDCKPNELDKLIAIPGDVSLDGLGISSQHRKMMKNVSVVIHSAATTRFNEPLRKAIRVNLKSTLEALKIAETLQDLKIFIHVSTFFSNTYLEYIKDKVYPAVFDWRTALKMLDSSYDHLEPILDIITDKTISGFFNTYLFTKHLSEQLVNYYRDKLPVGIYRPSIVVAACYEPEPGFSETKAGIMGLSAIWAAGIFKVLLCNSKVQLDLAPLDVCSKTLLIFTAKAAKLQAQTFQEVTPVGMWSSYGLVHNYFETFRKVLNKTNLTYPCAKAIWIPGVTFTNCPFVFTIYNFFLHLVPSVLIDILLRIFRQKPFLMALQRKVWNTTKVLSLFVQKTFKSSGPTDYQQILETERGTEFDMTFTKQFSTYEGLEETITVYGKGCRKYLLNEDDSTLPRGRQILACKILVYNILRGWVVYILLRAIYARVTTGNSRWK